MTRSYVHFYYDISDRIRRAGTDFPKWISVAGPDETKIEIVNK